MEENANNGTAALAADPRLDNEHWADVLVQALPYFKHWCGKTIVVKYGGSSLH